MTTTKSDGFSWPAALICVACVVGSVVVLFQPYYKQEDESNLSPFDLKTARTDSTAFHVVDSADSAASRPTHPQP